MRQRFWLWLYGFAGARVGPEVDAYWDRHWQRFVAIQLYKLVEAGKFGDMMLKVVLDELDEDPRGRAFRDLTRETRDVR